jgi:hypothetical protein
MLACFLDRENLTALVRAALAADTVGQLALVAVGAFGDAGRGKEVVAAALGSPLLGVAPFWIRHCSVPFDGPRQSGETSKSRADDEAKLFSVLKLELGRQIRKSIPLWIGRSRIAGTGCKIQVLATARAKPFAIFFAEGTAGQGE